MSAIYGGDSSEFGKQSVDLPEGFVAFVSAMATKDQALPNEKAPYLSSAQFKGGDHDVKIRDLKDHKKNYYQIRMKYSSSSENESSTHELVVGCNKCCIHLYRDTSTNYICAAWSTPPGCHVRQGIIELFRYINNTWKPI